MITTKMCTYGFFFGLTFIFCGTTIFDIIGVTVPAFRIGGGLLLAVAAWGLLYSSEETAVDKQLEGDVTRSDISLCPLAFPMFIGPATLTTLVGMTVDNAGGSTLNDRLLVLLALSIIIFATYLLAVFGNSVIRLLGKGGSVILAKVGGILLIAMSAQMIGGGIKDFFFTSPHPVMVVQQNAAVVNE
jgi:multiple antibiotic resistance protein